MDGFYLAFARGHLKSKHEDWSNIQSVFEETPEIFPRPTPPPLLPEAYTLSSWDAYRRYRPGAPSALFPRCPTHGSLVR